MGASTSRTRVSSVISHPLVEGCECHLHALHALHVHHLFKAKEITFSGEPSQRVVTCDWWTLSASIEDGCFEAFVPICWAVIQAGRRPLTEELPLVSTTISPGSFACEICLRRGRSDCRRRPIAESLLILGFSYLTQPHLLPDPLVVLVLLVGRRVDDQTGADAGGAWSATWWPPRSPERVWKTQPGRSARRFSEL